MSIFPTPSAFGSCRRRQLLLGGSALLLFGVSTPARANDVVAVRVWPAEDYSRVTIESKTALQATPRLIGSPPRLAVDVEGLTLDSTLSQLVAKVAPNDPNLAQIRVGQYQPGVVRIVLDLKHEIKPQVFALKPVAAYQHRLVFDLYPAHPPDLLEELIIQRMHDAAEATRASEAEMAADAPPAQTAQDASGDALGDLIKQRIEEASGQAPESEHTTVAGTPGPGKQRPGGQPIAPAPTLQQEANRLIIVAVDPGHGGEDPGAIGPGGTYEKDVVLQIALKLRDRINRSSAGGNPMRAFLTRDADFFVPLGTRVAKARQVKADLFISIHADSAPGSGARGASVYALSERGASSTTAGWLAKQENASDRIGGVNTGNKGVQEVLLDMSVTAQVRHSLNLGQAMLGHIKAAGPLHKASVERANFAVLRNPDVPSILIETAFISTPSEERRLRSASYQNQMADSIMSGIRRYFAEHPPTRRDRQI